MITDTTKRKIPEGLEASPAIISMFELYGQNYRWLVISATMLSSFAALLTSTIINVAIPEVMGSFGITQDEAQWLSAGFLASGTVTMLIASWAIASFGMRVIFTAAMVVFLGATILGGLAPNIEILTLSRIIQGAASGIITPISMLILYQVFPANRRGTAMGIYGIGVMLAPAIGPTIGGFMIDAYNWRYVFFVVVPFTLLSIPMAMMFMPEREDSARIVPFDWPGMILMTTFLVSLLTGLSDGQEHGWLSDYIVICMATSLLTGVGFIWWESQTRNPMLDLSLFLNLRFAASSFVTFVVGVGLYASTYLLPLFLQVLQGVPALNSGIMMLPAGLAMAVGFPIAGAISDRTQPRNLIVLGLFFFGLSTYVMKEIDLNTPFIDLMGWFILGRIGLALIFPSLNAASLNPLPLHQISQGSSIINFLRQLGGAFGVNSVAIFVSRRTALYADELSVAQTYSGTTLEMLSEVQSLVSSSGIPYLYQQITATGFLSHTIYNQASTLAFRDGFYLVAMLFFLSCLPTWLMKVDRQPIRAR